MKREFQKITIIKVRKPSEKDVNKDLQWLSTSLGLFGDRDKERSCFRVFVELIKSSRKNRAMTSDEIAFKSNLSRATVIHHLNKLIESGLVVHMENKYILRANSLEELLNEIRKDMLRVLDDIKTVSEDLDNELGINKRRNQRVISD